jgi:hypothetical protein
MKSLDIVPVSARLGRVGLEMEQHGDRRQGVEKQKDSNIQQLIDKILHIIAEEGKELRILNPLNHTENVVEESIASLHTLRNVLDSVQVLIRNISHRLHQFHTAAETHAEIERNALNNFIQHRRLKIDMTLGEIFSDTGVHRTLRDQQSAAELITMKFEEEIRDELQGRLLNALRRWKADMWQEYRSFLDDCTLAVDHVKNAPEEDKHRKEISRDFLDVLTNLITRRLMKQVDQRCQSALEGFQPDSLMASVNVSYAQPVSQLIINGLLSSFGVRFHLKKEKVKKSIRTTLLNGLAATEIKALELYDAQTRLLDGILQNTIQQLLVDRLRNMIHNITQITNETLNIGRQSLEELETIRKEEI